MNLFIAVTSLLAAGQIGFFLVPLFRRTRDDLMSAWAAAIVCTLLQDMIGGFAYLGAPVEGQLKLVPPLLRMLWLNLLTGGLIVGAILTVCLFAALFAPIVDALFKRACRSASR